MNKKLVKGIDLDSLSLENTSFITPDLEEYFSDLVWQAKYKTTQIKISFLFEHKSYVVTNPHIQLMRYITEHLESQAKAKEPLSVVIPIIVYHGENEWKVREFSEYFEGIDDVLKQYIPNFKYELTDLSRYSDEELIDKGIGKLVNVFLAMIHVRDLNYILENYAKIFIFAENDLKDAGFTNFFQTIFIYLYKNVQLNSHQLNKITNTINEPLKEFTMSAYDLLIEKGIEKGIEQGIEQGISLGEYQATRRVVISLLNKFPNWSNEEIAEVANTSSDIVATIKQEITN